MTASRHVRQVEAISHGTVIDHIPADRTLAVANLLCQPDDQVFIGQNLRSQHLGTKGVVKIAGKELSDQLISRLSLIAPSAKMSIIRDYRVVKKSRIPVPDRFTDVVHCPNPNCVTNHEPVRTDFAVVAKDPLKIRCHFCERRFDADEVKIH